MHLNLKSLLPTLLLNAAGFLSCRGAETETPVENSLGMKLVPVAATPGVLWSTMEVREKEYAAYCQETGEGWRKPEFETGAEHPVVNVTPAAAAEFCIWLTMREMDRGLISGAQEYRLPKDREWSLAAGLAGEKGKTPNERHLTISGRWPWGEDPHPAAGAGNFADEAYHQMFPCLSWLRGVDDGFAFSAPAGSFAPDANGLFDLGGNVSEWVAPVGGKAWARGGSWHPLAGAEPLKTLEFGWRTAHGLAASAVSEFTGFRVVLSRVDNTADDLPRNELRRAAQEGNPAETTRILEKDRFADFQDSTGMSALHRAATFGHTAVVEKLIRHNASVRLKADGGFMALDATMIFTRFSPRTIPSARLLIAAGTPLDRDPSEGMPLLAMAVKSAPLDLLSMLVEKGAFPKEPDRRAAVMASLGKRRFVEREYESLLALLTKAGGDLKSPDRYGYNALHTACSVPRVNRSQLAWLLSQGLEVNSPGKSGLTPLGYALRHSTETDCAEDAVLYLLEKGARPTAADTAGVLFALEVAGRGRLLSRFAAAGVEIKAAPPEQSAKKAAEMFPEMFESRNNWAGAFNLSPLGIYASYGDAALLEKAAAQGASAVPPDKEQWDNGLVVTVVCGRADLLQILIANGCSLKRPKGKSILSIASQGGSNRTLDQMGGMDTSLWPSFSGWMRRASLKANHAECVRLLLAAGVPADDGLEPSPKPQKQKKPAPAAGVNPRPSGLGATPLAFAGQANRAEIVEELLKAGAGIEATDESGYTSLISAAELGSSEAVRVLLMHGANVNAATHNGVTALMEAAGVGSLEMVEMLLAKGPNLEAFASPPQDGTALGAAVSSGHRAIVARLFEAGARTSIWKKDDPRGTLLHTAVRGALQRKSRVLATSPLFTPPALEDHLAIIGLLVKKGLNPNAPSKGTGTPLATAFNPQLASPDTPAIASKLLELGADPNAGAPSPPLHLAVQASPDLLRLLLEKGADPNVAGSTNEKPTPLHYAAWHNKVEAARLLLDRGAKPDAYDGGQQTPLFVAVQHQHTEMVRVLVAAKVNLEKRNTTTQNITALHLAAHLGNIEIIRILTAAGADPTAGAGHPIHSPEMFGATPRRIAAFNGHTGAASLLATVEQQWARRAPKAAPPPKKPAPEKSFPPPRTQKKR